MSKCRICKRPIAADQVPCPACDVITDTIPSELPSLTGGLRRFPGGVVLAGVAALVVLATVTACLAWNVRQRTRPARSVSATVVSPADDSGDRPDEAGERRGPGPRAATGPR